MARQETGYQRSDNEEPLILEPEDWKPHEWETLCKMAGNLPPEHTERIVISNYTLESYVSAERGQRTKKELPEVVEWCNNCETEIEMRWDVLTQGYRAFCPVCGERLMLCDECQHRGESGKYKDDCDFIQETDECRFNQQEVLDDK